MSDITKYIPTDDLKLVSNSDLQWLSNVFNEFNGYPNLEEVWGLMNVIWDELDCDPFVMDERIGKYYSHPVWLLNGLFIEQHPQSIQNRKLFVDWVVRQSPSRLAEFGGGFGSLARMVGQKLPATEIEVIEPHPHPIAIARANKTGNVRYKPALSGEYDLIIATDVFEHVPDPLQLVFDTAQHLRRGGQYLIANCFAPVILCHLPQTFHFFHSWDNSMNAIGLIPSERVAYGRAFINSGEFDLDAGRDVENVSRKIWRCTRYLPGRISRPLTEFLLSI